jgi:hypothetical protein
MFPLHQEASKETYSCGILSDNFQGINKWQVFRKRGLKAKIVFINHHVPFILAAACFSINSRKLFGGSTKSARDTRVIASTGQW